MTEYVIRKGMNREDWCSVNQRIAGMPKALFSAQAQDQIVE